MTGKITGVVKPYGLQQKKDGSGTYGPCGLYDVSLESGELVKVLLWNNERQVGDEVKLIKKGDFYNEEKPSRQELDLQPIVNMLESIDEKLDRLLGNDRDLLGDVEDKPARDWDSVGRSKPTASEPVDEYPEGYFN